MLKSFVRRKLLFIAFGLCAVALVIGNFEAESAYAAPQGGEWVVMDPPPMPRANHSAVWTGEYMIVWGGETGRESTLNCVTTGGIYNPKANYWKSMSTAHAPSGRFGHTAHWTPLGMFVWGGVNKYKDKGKSVRIYFNTGGIYNPASDQWREISSDGAPASRLYYASVLAGNKVIVWGGQGDDKAIFGDGAAYDLDSDTWKPISTADAPTARILPTAVWTGTEMVVWGGRDKDSKYCNTGARYNPEKDTWRPITEEGAPTARAGHTAVWSGSRMIVWGGIFAASGRKTEYLDSGAAYDPRTNRWSPLSSEKAPVGRYYHSAIWAGEKMIVWGGKIKTTSKNGGVYYPDEDKWELITLLGAPYNRIGHTAIWTGEKMIVWGGTTTDQVEYIDYIGIYVPPR